MFVAQWTERLLTTPYICSSNPGIGALGGGLVISVLVIYSVDNDRSSNPGTANFGLQKVV